MYINCKFPSSDMSNYKFVSNGKKVYTGRKRVYGIVVLVLLYISTFI